ncbi:hypothetical protein VTL71DRAFT_4409 [Oculimacula yallundae]|uniref:Uncharacterized protein n=1 Tax=Oculimacula yallundae TaxID=86028 RepID=A0ABR4C1W9_9HELO
MSSKSNIRNSNYNPTLERKAVAVIIGRGGFWKADVKMLKPWNSAYIFAATLDHFNTEATLREKAQDNSILNFHSYVQHFNDAIENFTMVLLTMTASMVEALGKIQGFERGTGIAASTPSNDVKAQVEEQTLEHEVNEAGKREEPVLLDPRIGNPILHGQVVELSQNMKDQKLQPCRLEDLLRGARIYSPPPAPKSEPTSEYKALMARLRREEEARTYERMTNPPPPMETFSQRFPADSAARAFDSSHQNINASDPDDDGITFADVDRQMALIFNVLISIVACAVAIWIAAKWWSTPARLALSMSGSALVGVAEVVVYSGYLRRVTEAKGKEKQVKEVKEIVKTWVVGAGNDTEDVSEKTPVNIETREDDQGLRARKRMKDVS